MRQIDKQSTLRSGMMLAVGVTALVSTAPAWATPADSGGSDGASGPLRQVADHTLLLDIDEVAKAELARDSDEGPYSDRGVKFGSGVTLGANAVLLRGLTLGGLVNLAKSREGDGDRSELGGAFRAGYLIALGGPFTLWPNASVGYSRATSPYHIDGDEFRAPEDGEQTTHSWQAAGEARLLAEVTSHVGLTAGVKYTHVLAAGIAFNEGDVRNWYPGKQAISGDLGLAAWF
ncbi:MAG: hypothetical protein KC492_02905 [Myxococcales bacterium]|nr:hypothetical protein [Myxococcales bacterium]